MRGQQPPSAPVPQRVRHPEAERDPRSEAVTGKFKLQYRQTDVVHQEVTNTYVFLTDFDVKSSLTI